MKKGEELVRLDSSLIEEKVSQQKIVYEKAKALMIDAEKTWKAADIAVAEYIEGNLRSVAARPEGQGHGRQGKLGDRSQPAAVHEQDGPPGLRHSVAARCPGLCRAACHARSASRGDRDHGSRKIHQSQDPGRLGEHSRFVRSKNGIREGRLRAGGRSAQQDETTVGEVRHRRARRWDGGVCQRTERARRSNSQASAVEEGADHARAAIDHQAAGPDADAGQNARCTNPRSISCSAACGPEFASRATNIKAS